MSATESHHPSAFDKLFHHKKRDEHHDDEHGAHPPSGESPRQEESEGQRVENRWEKKEDEFKKYIEKDEELEEEGKTYGGLM